MPRTVGVLKETFPGERCVAIVPRSVEVLKKAEMTVMVEPSAGAEAGYTDDQYTAKGAHARVAAGHPGAVRYSGAVPQCGRESTSRTRGSAAPAQGTNCAGLGRTAHGAAGSQRFGGGRRVVLCAGADPAHDARAEHGRAEFAGHDFRLRVGTAGGQRRCLASFRC